MAIPRIAITMGDPAGIGPEIVLKAASRLRSRVAARELALVVTGAAWCLAEAAERLGVEYPFVAVPQEPATASWPPFAVLDLGLAASGIVPGEVSAAAGEVAYQAIAAAVRMAMAGQVHAISTAPINKEALNLAGHHYSGHTELLAALTGSRDSVMMLAHGLMRVSHISTHVALADVPRYLTEPRLRRVVELTADALRRLDIARPRIGVAALNPHAGENGLFGREDIDITAPALQRLRADGYDVEGPVPGDTVFVKLHAGQFDAVVAMYHDQGHIPVKLLGFAVDPSSGGWSALNGVNITLGLPLVRTSVDHGTAFDIAGKGIASEQSLVDAIEFALRLARAPSGAGANTRYAKTTGDEDIASARPEGGLRRLHGA
ncbi:MAG: 4-hydroxythreonine-4-phosphate dehydrogenase PdxA [Acetobacteraceae bacterium]